MSDTTSISVDVKHIKWSTIMKDNRLHCYWKVYIPEVEHDFTISMFYDSKQVRGTLNLATLDMNSHIDEAKCETAILEFMNRDEHDYEEYGKFPLVWEGEFNPILALRSLLADLGFKHVNSINLHFDELLKGDK